MAAANDIVWQQPLCLWLALYPWAIAGARWLWRGRDANAYARPAFVPWAIASLTAGGVVARYGRFALSVAAWLLFAAALAGPRSAQPLPTGTSAEAGELLLLVDVSHSMTARDIVPSRLARVRFKILDLLERAQHLRIGLLVFAGDAHLLTPPTADYSLIRYYLGMLQPGLLPTEGSNPDAALRLAAENFSDAGRPRLLLVLSDGEGASAQTTALAAALARQGIGVSVMGVGTTAGAPLLAADGGWLRYADQDVISVLNEPLLQAVAQAGDGRYARLGDDSADLRQLYDDGMARRLAATAADAEGLHQWQYHFQWLLLPALVLFLASRLRRPERQLLVLWIALTVGLPLMLQAPPSQAGDDALLQQAGLAFAAGRYQDARRDYAGVAGFAGRLGEGASAYRLGELAAASRQFTLAVLAADSDDQRADALFNLANSRYQAGAFAQAADNYRDVLRYRPQDAAAQRNLTYALAMLAQAPAGGDGAPGRPGRGPRRARLSEGTALNDRASVSVDESSDSVSLPPGAAAATDAAASPGLQAHPVVPQREQFVDRQWVYEKTTTDRIILRAAALQVDESDLWRRLFEAEENISAPLAAPLVTPGVAPW